MNTFFSYVGVSVLTMLTIIGAIALFTGFTMGAGHWALVATAGVSGALVYAIYLTRVD